MKEPSVIRFFAGLRQFFAKFVGVIVVQFDHGAKQRRHARAFGVLQRFLVAIAGVDLAGVKRLQMIQNVPVQDIPPMLGFEQH